MSATTPTPPRPGAASALLRWQLTLAHRLLEDTVSGLPNAAMHQQSPDAAIRQQPPVPGISAIACYAQIVYCEDVTVGGVLAGRSPLALSTWAGRTGLDELPPLGRLISRPLSEQPNWSTWGRRVQIDLPMLQAYARAVYAATDTYIATLPDEALDPDRRDLPGCLLTALLLTISMRRGEIVALALIEGQPTVAAAPTSRVLTGCRLPRPTPG
jgi:hypothetical protein